MSLWTHGQKKYTISGYVREEQSGELLLGVNIYIPGTQTGTVSNNYGFYSITLPEGPINLTYSYVGYAPQNKKFTLSKDTIISVNLESQNQLQGVEIVGSNERISDDVQMSIVKVPIKQVREIPALLGEKDVFKVLQLMPGVRSGSEGNSGLYVRGGGPDQNLIILDDATVYNAYHLFGFFSVFNGDALKSVELMKGGFPSRYGGRLSSVLDISMKDGNRKEFGGEASVGLISSRLMLEGPIIKDKASFIVSGRRTYLDVVSQPIIRLVGDGESLGYYFYDLNAKANYELDGKNRFYLSTYFGRDKFFAGIKDRDFEEDYQLYWQNFTVTARWNHVYNNKLFGNTSLIYSRYRFNVGMQTSEIGGDNFELDYFSGIEDIGLKWDMNYIPANQHYIRFGAMSTRHVFTPSAAAIKGTGLPDDLEAFAKKIIGVESALYVEDEMKFSRMKLNLGIRLTHFNVNSENYYSLEPRVLYSYMINEDLSIKASYTYMNQYIHLLSTTGISLPIDLWVPSTELVAPKKSHQIAAGFAKDFTDPNFSLSIEGYYKTMGNIIAYKEGASFLEVGAFENNQEFQYEDAVTTGEGYSYGAEFLLQRKYGKLTGWVGYTLSWTIHQFDDLNFGEEFFARHDRRNDVSLVVIYQPSEKITLSGSWVYGSGDAITLPKAEYLAPVHDPVFDNMPFYSRYVQDYGARNDFRMAPYHRLDFGVQFHKKLKKNRLRTWEVSVYNVYNRANPFFYYLGSDFRAGNYQTVLKQVSLFPIIPSVSYYLKF
jgi:hypothetical protein